MQNKITEYADRINLIKNKQVVSIEGDGSTMTSLILKDSDKEEKEAFTADKIFLAVGYEPNTTIFENDLKVSAGGYIVVNSDMQTTVPGVYAAGDVIEGADRKAPVAAGAGIIAADSIIKFLKS